MHLKLAKQQQIGDSRIKISWNVHNERPPSIGIFNVAGSPAPENDLPSEPVILPEEYPDWGVTVNAPQQPSCGDVTPIVRYAGTTA